MNTLCITTVSCIHGALVPMVQDGAALDLPCPAHVLHGEPSLAPSTAAPSFRSKTLLPKTLIPGSVLHGSGGTPLLRVESLMNAAPFHHRKSNATSYPESYYESDESHNEELYPVTQTVPMLRALCDIKAQKQTMTVHTDIPTAAVITLSDKGASGERLDTCGPALADAAARALPGIWVRRFMLPDEPDLLKALVCDLALVQHTNLIITTGGTGLSPRDTTPEALIPLLTRRLEGMEHAMMQAGLTHTPRAALSRCLAGCIGTSLVLALPGSRKAALENISPLLPILDHALVKLGGDAADCGRM